MGREDAGAVARAVGAGAPDPADHYATCTPDSLERSIADVFGAASVLLTQVAEMAASYEARRLHEADGMRDMVSWLVMRLGCSRTMALEICRLGRASSSTSVLQEAIGSGELSFEAAAAIGRLAGEPGGTAGPGAAGEDGAGEDAAVEDATGEAARLIASMAQEAKGRSVAEVQAMVSRAIRATLAGENKAHATRYLRWRYGEEHFSLSGRLTFVEGALLSGV
ncbi:MAG: hypothetical protein ACYDH5_17315, partial [Acidimicrobiales bacterium]